MIACTISEQFNTLEYFNNLKMETKPKALSFALQIDT